MIQFNLLPDVKLQYIKAQRIKHLVTLISIIAAGVALAIFIISILYVDVVQKKSLRDLNSDITTYSNQLKDIPNLNKILTVQNQLNTLTTLHDQKVVASRLFTYVGQITPNQATISDLKIDFTANTMTITGDAPSLDAVNSFTDTLKTTTYTTDSSGSTTTPAFSQVVLSSFTRNSSKASYTITFSFDPTIFNSASNVKLQVLNSTSSNVASLFKRESGQ